MQGMFEATDWRNILILQNNKRYLEKLLAFRTQLC